MMSDIESLKNMPVVILCGGEGTRFKEQTMNMPKPLVSIGDRPLLWHLMDIYARQGFKNFILCLGYKGWMIKDYFHSYERYHRDYVLDLRKNGPVYLDDQPTLDWKITFADTGAASMTGSRVKRIEKYVPDELFMLTYGDGLADIDLTALLKFHLSHDKIGTVTAVQPCSQFGELKINGDKIEKFSEKPQFSSLINGGFFVFKRDFFKYLDRDENCVLEQDPLERLTMDNELFAYKHSGFWQCLDTYKDHQTMNRLWEKGTPLWR